MSFGLADSHADGAFFAVIVTKLSCLSMPRAVRGYCGYRVCGAPAVRDPIGSGREYLYGGLRVQIPSKRNRRQVPDCLGNQKMTVLRRFLFYFSFSRGVKYCGPGRPLQRRQAGVGRARRLEQPRQKQGDGSAAEEHPQVNRPNHVRGELPEMKEFVHGGRPSMLLACETIRSAAAHPSNADASRTLAAVTLT
jgi:hypothetical protein